MRRVRELRSAERSGVEVRAEGGQHLLQGTDCEVALEAEAAVAGCGGRLGKCPSPHRADAFRIVLDLAGGDLLSDRVDYLVILVDHGAVEIEQDAANHTMTLRRFAVPGRTGLRL